MNATKAINTIIASGAGPRLTSGGFSKKNLDFHRRVNSVVQVVNFQLSQGNRGGDGSFYVNVGLAFDELWIHMGHDLSGPMRKRLERPFEHECHFRSRLENLILDCPRWWVVASSRQHAQFFSEMTATQGREIATDDQSRQRVASYLGSCMERVIVELDQIRTAKDLLGHRWRQVAGNQGVIRQLEAIL